MIPSRCLISLLLQGLGSLEEPRLSCQVMATQHSLRHRNPIAVKSVVRGEVWHKAQKWDSGELHEMLRTLNGQESKENILTFPSVLGGKCLCRE